MTALETWRGLTGRLVICALLLVCPALPSAQEPNAYPIATLPAGTQNAATGFDLSNPRATLRSFTQAAALRDYETAALALMTASDPDTPRPELARKLAEVIDRQLWIDGGSLPDRPDAVIETVGDAPRAGETRRSIALGTIDRGSFPVTIRLNRYKTDAHPAVWLFGQDTVDAIPSLYALHGPGWIETQLNPWWRARTFLSVRHWEIAALPLLLLCAAGIAWLVSGIIHWLKGLAGTGWPARAVGATGTPLAILAAAIFVQTAINSALGFSGEITSVLTPILIAAIVIALVMAVLRAIDAGLDVVTHRFVGEIDDKLSRDDRHFYTSIYALRRVITLLAFLFGAGLIFWEIGIFRNVGISLLASAGVATVVLGIAAQTVLGNILASLQIALAKPIRIGDSVHYEGEWAYVESIFYTYVRLRTWDDRRLLVPVKYFISHPFENWSMIDAKMTRTFYITVDHMADTDALRAQFKEIASADADVINEDDIKMLVLGHDADGIRCRFYATAPDPTTAWDMHARLQEKMLAWIADTHPEWWPRERVKSVGADQEDPLNGYDG